MHRAINALRKVDCPSASQEHSGRAEKRGPRRDLPGAEPAHQSSDWGHFPRALGGGIQISQGGPLRFCVPGLLQGTLGGGVTRQSEEKGLTSPVGCRLKSSLPPLLSALGTLNLTPPLLPLKDGGTTVPSQQSPAPRQCSVTIALPCHGSSALRPPLSPVWGTRPSPAWV